MSDQPAFNSVFRRDGTSQTERLLPALDPDYVAIDERSLKDLLAFAREYARTLTYFNLDDEAQGDWSAFLASDVDLDDVITFMQDPAKLSPDKALRFSRPHFVLFLTFLQLLTLAQQQLNTFTRRHLDFYYQQALRITRQPSVPDRVNVLVDLDPTTDEFLLPAATLLNAGVDSAGQNRVYSTDRDLVVNRAQIARLSSIYRDQLVIGIREAREDYNGPKEEAFIYMLQIALGRPNPGDPLSRYDSGTLVDYPFLVDLQGLIEFVPTTLFMNYAEFRNLIQLKQQRDNSDPEWDEINRLLGIAYAARTGQNNFTVTAANKRNFDANFLAATGIQTMHDPSFDGLREVQTVYDLYNQRIRDTIQQYIQTTLHFADLNDFYSLMQIKIRIDGEWDEINRILQTAGQRRSASFSFAPDFDPTNFDANLKAALGDLTYPAIPGEPAIGSIDQYDARFVAVEHYFFTSAENFSLMMDTAQNPQAMPQQWSRVYSILADAHEQQVYADRKTRLQQEREEHGFEAMLAFVLGEQAASGLSNLERVIELISSPKDADFLRTIGGTPEANVTPADWDTTYSIVERAQRVLLPTPVAQKIQWVNLYSNEDATSATVTLGIESDTSNPRWRTFGQPQTAAPDAPPPLSFGWAVSSPLLALSEGQRVITLTLGLTTPNNSFKANADAIDALLTPTNPADAVQPFLVQVSTAKGWIEPDSVTIQRIDNYFSVPGVAPAASTTLPALQFQLTFAQSAAALATFPGSPDSAWPVLRVLLRQIWQSDTLDNTVGHFVTYYQPFEDLILLRTHLRATVTGLTPAQVQNDDAVLNPKKPFEPFGTNAVAGAHFYLSHPELVFKKLDSLDFHLEWMGAPKNLADRYKNYPELANGSNTSFTVDVSLIDDHLELGIAPNAPLFESGDATTLHTISVKNVSQSVADARPGYSYDRADRLVQASDLLDWNRYIQWELNSPDFQQENYPALAAQKALELSVAVANGQKPAASAYQVNPPYTPKLKTLTINYTASDEILIEQYQPGLELNRLYHVQPFGSRELQPDPALHQAQFLPQFDNEGELYIGVQQVNPPQNLSLLFQMAEGSANPDRELFPVHWSYLSGDQWISLEDGDLLLDTTRGLINSGIVVLALDVTRPSSLLPVGCYWIRAVIEQNSDSVCDTVAIQTQAVQAVFVDNNNAPDHFSQPLPAKTITDLVQPLPQIKGIRQPYTSFGGLGAEQDRTFYTRISERLRHKQRALTIWDYEHLVLQQFPQIYKAKCLPVGPGSVEIIVIPDVSNKLPFNPFEPKAPSDLIADIEAFLGQHTPAYATVTVKNANFIPVKVRFAVRFRPGYNQGFYKKRLNDELNRFLSPWAYEDGADIVIGGRIYANVIINFIEDRPYVDYVDNIKLFSSEDGKTFKLILPSGEDGYWVETSQPDGVLVAAPQHEIDMILGTSTEDEILVGINFMKIELDFIVG